MRRTHAGLFVGFGLVACGAGSASAPTAAPPSHAIAAGSPSASASAPDDGYRPARYANGFFTVKIEQGRAWFVAPDGQRFLSLGVNAVSGASAPSNAEIYDPVRRQFGGDEGAFRASALKRLSAWHFTTLGAWCDPKLYDEPYPHTVIVYIADGIEHPLEHVFDPTFAPRVAENAKRLAAHVSDRYLVGYFLDNELPWWGQYGWHADGQESLLVRYARKPASDPGKQELVEWLTRRYRSEVKGFNAAYHVNLPNFSGLSAPIELESFGPARKADAAEFAGVVAERFFGVTVPAVRAVDPHHLILGVRFAGENPWPVVVASAKTCDVVSINHYQPSGDIDERLLDNLYAATRKPVLITEYSWSARANQSGDPNTKGAMVLVDTQAERAEHLSRYASQALALPYVVGLHWFAWADEPPGGRFDGEDQNYGLVDVHDGTYDLLTAEHRRINRAAVDLHSAATGSLPEKLDVPLEPHLGAMAARSAARVFFRPAPSARVDVWGDTSTGGKSSATTSASEVQVTYDTGKGWGTGATFRSNDGPRVSGNAVDVGGYATLEFEALAPKGLRFRIGMGEAGSREPWQASYAGVNGSDGEAYVFSELRGSGRWERYRVDLRELERRGSWGNQRGNQTLDLSGLETVDLMLPGSQGGGVVRLRALTFTP